MKINRDDSQIFIEPEQRRMASARQGRDCSFAHPFFPDELFHYLRNCAPLQSGTPCQICTRERLAGADQLQHDIPVDSSRSFAGRKLNIGQIDVANAFDILSVLQLFLSRKLPGTRPARDVKIMRRSLRSGQWSEKVRYGVCSFPPIPQKARNGWGTRHPDDLTNPSLALVTAASCTNSEKTIIP
jgi:hypothetical protein